MGAFTVKDNITSFDHEQITIVNTQVTVSHVSPLKIIIGTNTLVPSHSVPAPAGYGTNNTHTHTHTHTNTHTHTQTNTHTHTHTHTRSLARTHARTHTHILSTHTLGLCTILQKKHIEETIKGAMHIINGNLSCHTYLSICCVFLFIKSSFKHVQLYT